jgi:hypothetical protein
MAESILIPVVVAAATTLLIEYAAKPWLEVRKDAILERHRSRRDLILAVQKAEFLRGRLLVIMDEHYPLPEDIEKVKQEYAAATRYWSDQAGLVDLEPDALDGLMQRACARSWAFSQELLHEDLDDDELRAASADLDKTVDLLDELLRTPRYRLLKRRALLQRAQADEDEDERVLAETDSE